MIGKYIHIYLSKCITAVLKRKTEPQSANSISFFLNLPLTSKSSLDDHLNILLRCFKESTMLLKIIPALTVIFLDFFNWLYFLVYFHSILFDKAQCTLKNFNKKKKEILKCLKVHIFSLIIFVLPRCKTKLQPSLY